MLIIRHNSQTKTLSLDKKTLRKSFGMDFFNSKIENKSERRFEPFVPPNVGVVSRERNAARDPPPVARILFIPGIVSGTLVKGVRCTHPKKEEATGRLCVAREEGIANAMVHGGRCCVVG